MRAFLAGACMRRLVAAAVLCLAVAAPALAASNPALWKVRDADTTVYLFGTIHAMKEGVQWHFPALDKALTASGTLYIEAADINPKTLQPLVVKYGLDPAHPLSGKLGKQEIALLKQAATELGIHGGMTTLNMMKPWLAGITIASAPLIKAGYDPKLGVDKQLQARFEQAGKPIKGLESAKQQILFLSQLPESVQLKLLQKSLHEYAHADTMLTRLVHAWKRGDTKALARTIV
ncbi:MAG TPA: TraB/GumN family protein, partial [Oleiagrimonas sp.]|nr:TraB/GumN family protein [Oleiagrimonas sp.]